MEQRSITKVFMIFEDIEVPLIHIILNLDDVVPGLGTYIDKLLEPFFFLNLLCWINLFIIAMDFFKEVIKINLKPLCGITCLISCQVKPLLRIHIHVLLLVIHVKVKFIEFVGFNDLNSLLSFLPS